MRNLPFVSIIVLNYNGKQYLKECFGSVRKINYPKNRYEVIMGDNASSDDSISYVKKNFPWVKILKFDKNYGFAEGNNKCVEKARGEYVVFLNNDTKVDKKWLIELVKGFDFDDDVAICGSKLLFYDRPDVINSAGGKLAYMGCSSDIGLGEKDQKKFNEYNFVGYVCGASLMIKKQLFDELGGFDPDYFAYCEDTDLCWRAWLYGHKVLYVPNSTVLHKFGGSFGKNRATPLKSYHIQKNRIINILKNFDDLYIIKGLIISLAYDVYRNFFYLKERNFKVIKSILKADCYVLLALPQIFSKRRIIQKNRVLSDNVLGRRVFSSLKSSIKEELKMSKKFKNFFEY